MTEISTRCCKCHTEVEYPHHVRFTEPGPDALVNPAKQKHYCKRCWEEEEKTEFNWFKSALWE